MNKHKDISPNQKAIYKNLVNKLYESCTPADAAKYCLRILNRNVKKSLHIRDFQIHDKIFFWINGQYALGILASCSKNAVKDLNHFYKPFVRASKIGINVFDSVETFIHAFVVLSLYTKYNQAQYRQMVDDAIESLNLMYQQSNVLEYWRGEGQFYIDTLGMVCEFCALAAEALDKPELGSIATTQIDFTLKQISKYNVEFPHHAYKIDDQKPLGSNTWGRGIGWYTIGLVACAKIDQSKYGHTLKKHFETLSKYCDEGVFYDDFATKLHIDTSPMAMIGYAANIAFENNLLQKTDISFYASLLEQLFANVDKHGNVDNCSGECIDFGKYSNEFGNYYAQGYTLSIEASI